MEQHVELERQFLEVDEAKDPEAVALESYIASISGADTGVGWNEIFAARESIVVFRCGLCSILSPGRSTSEKGGECYNRQ